MVRMNTLTDAIKSINTTELSKTVFLPKSKFPHRHNPKIELSIQEDLKFAQTYLEQDPCRKPYVIHDGPPFANGSIHLGHTINKIMKDIAARYAMITGHKVEFITGWDCHGLPIELQVLKVIDEQQRQSNYGGSLLESQPSPEHFRAKARAYAKSQIDLQMASFKRIGLLTDWNKRYTTDDPSYVANQLRAFSQLYEQKLIFKDLMPVHWSLVNRTSVADADIEYKTNHTSKCAYILYEIIEPPFFRSDLQDPLCALTWTTTPWTLLENRALAFNKEETYCIVKAWKPQSDDRKNILISHDTMHAVNNLLQRLGYQYEMASYVPGRSLKGLKYKPLLHTLIDNRVEGLSEPKPFIDADYVSGSKGTGLVHIAPNYGFEDFDLIKQNKMKVNVSLVDHGGRFRKDSGNILMGKYVFSDGTQEILSLLDKHNALLYTELIQHSYPYESRTQQPVIIRTSQQMFIDTSRIITRCLKAIETCSFFPENRRQSFISMLSSRPSWCISRQRVWGTPIPVLYEKEDESLQKMITHPSLVEYFCKLLYKRRSMDYWWTIDNEELIPQDLLNKCKLPYDSTNLIRGTDIFDVWSDSGLSWHTISNGLNDGKSQADLYLEGVDQIRGWFSASSILSMALRGCLPSKRFFIHGFALDDKGRKMSKSSGNVIDPVKLFENYGVDPVRLWAARAAGDHRDIIVKEQEFKTTINDNISKIRNTLRYLIGALQDHDGVEVNFDHTKLQIFDQYYLDKLYRFGSTLDDHYKNYRFDMVANECNRFLVTDLSPVYISTIKDILYCEDLDSKRRKSCLIVLNITYNILMRCLYPITPHIIHEAAGYMRTAEPLNEWQDLAYKASWRNDVLHGQLETLVKIRTLLYKMMSARFDNMRDSDAVLYLGDKKVIKNISKLVSGEPELMMELFKTSTFNLCHKDNLKAPEDVVEVDCEKAIGTVELPNLKLMESNDDEATDIQGLVLLSSWKREAPDGEFRLGGSLQVNQNNRPIRFEMCYKRSDNQKCIRCRRYTVLNLSEGATVCDRCRGVLNKLDAHE